MCDKFGLNWFVIIKDKVVVFVDFVIDFYKIFIWKLMFFIYYYGEYYVI